jgi:hypothetical protein
MYIVLGFLIFTEQKQQKEGLTFAYLQEAHG